MSVLFASFAVAGSLILQDPAPPAAPVPAAQVPPSATQLEDVVVQRQRLERAIRNFVDEVAAPSPGRGPARWDRRVCVGVVNVRNPAAQHLVDRVSQVAMDVGLEPGEPGCKANVVIIGTSDGPALAQALVDATPRAFRPNWSGSDRGAVALEKFVASEAPVRWWHVALPVDSQTGAPVVRIPGQDDEPRMTAIFASSRLRTQVQNNLDRVFVIVDFGRAEGLNFNQLSDYIAMVALAQIDPDAATGSFNSVLNLFEQPGGAGIDGMTDWDRSYLSALYDAELNQLRPSHQASSVSNAMAHDRRAQAAAPAEDEDKAE
ncbi:hypothetical protein [Brevundimonas sp.]|uniref:hypothetical protein n=1 Tax=Brevundimonas sp. TaxID=1871086 RepID=UPI0025C640A7|nr:hypothetical protein [Brevundimonas sp.]